MQLKKWEQMMCLCDRLLVTKCLKIPFKMASLLSCLLCVDTRGATVQVTHSAVRTSVSVQFRYAFCA